MPRKPNGIHIEPALTFFNYCCVVAHVMIESGEEPAWFREHFGQGRRIEKEYALPPMIPLVFALALDLSFAMPTPDALKRFRRKLKDERSRLKKARAGLLGLRDFPLMPLRPAYLGHRETPDSSVEFEYGPDPIDEIVQAIDTFLEKLSGVGVGRRTSPVLFAVRRLNRFAERNNPELTPARCDALCHDLFDKVRERHGHRSHSPDRDQDEMPRFSDLLTRSKRSVPGKRKTGQEMG